MWDVGKKKFGKAIRKRMVVRYVVWTVWGGTLEVEGKRKKERTEKICKMNTESRLKKGYMI